MASLCLFLPHVELIQLRKGLRETLQLEALISVYHKEVHGFLVASSSFEVTPDFLTDSFVIHYSEQGGKKRIKEEGIILDWCEYVTECAGINNNMLALLTTHDIFRFIPFLFITCRKIR